MGVMKSNISPTKMMKRVYDIICFHYLIINSRKWQTNIVNIWPEQRNKGKVLL